MSVFVWKFANSSSCFSFASTAFSAMRAIISSLSVSSSFQRFSGFAFAQFRGSHISSSSSISAMKMKSESFCTLPERTRLQN